jgi:hypothetical protein
MGGATYQLVAETMFCRKSRQPDAGLGNAPQ